MLTTGDIRKLTFDTAFRKGQQLSQLHYIKDFYYSIYNLNEITVAEVTGTVREPSGESYETSVTVEEDYDGIQEYRCVCEDMFRYDGLCRHCVALLVEYVQKRRVKEVLDVKWNRIERTDNSLGTKAGMKEILNRYAMLENSHYLIPEGTAGQVELTPYFYFYSSGMFAVEFKIGITQKYVLKDIFGFLDAVKYAKRVSYGKKLEFYHNIEAFTDRARKLIIFMQKQRTESRRIALHQAFYEFDDELHSGTKERILELDEGGVEQFLAAMKGEYFEGDIPTLPEDTVWYMSEEEKKPGLSIKGRGEGAVVGLEVPEVLCGVSRYFYCEKGTIYPGSAQLKEKLGDFFEYLLHEEGKKTYLAPKELSAFCRDMLPLLRKYFSVTSDNFNEAEFLPEKPEYELYLDKLEYDVVLAKLLSVYGEEKYNVLEKEDLLEGRNVEEEMRMRRAVELYFPEVDVNGSLFVLKDNEELLYRLLAGGLQRLSEFTAIYTSEAFQNLKVRDTPHVVVGISLKSGLLELKVQSEEMPLDELASLLSRYNRKKKFIRLKNGEFLKVEEDAGLLALAAVKEDLHLSEAKLKAGTISLPKYRAMYLDGSLKNRQDLTVDKNRGFRAMVRNMKTIEDSDYEPPESLKTVMREYQKIGFYWLSTLKANGFGGILADDMGLGKTLQVISLFLSEWEENTKEGEERRPSIVICPASLVYNWEKEIKRFAPQLSTAIISGSAREREELIKNSRGASIFITSYDLMKRDVNFYKDIVFSIQVIDEAQYIKNAATQAAKGVKEIKASFKLALTGTPIENRLSELWSIFDYLMPGYLFTYQRFRSEIEIPVIVNQDEDKTKRLRYMICPFILRRLKEDVLKDLPEKLEENIYAKLEGEQLSLYNAHVQKMKILLNEQSDSDFQKGRFQILAELTKLRQICCDPGLLYENYQGGSAKIDTCMELIEDAVNGGHKILLFSQFTTMLEHLQERMREAGITFHTLTGSVSKEKRMQLVDSFNEDEIPVFCISLKAGGTGLNLTAADIVIHFDPWWNIAVENQATDRAHRIGQKQVVTVYKLVAQETIEEKIVEMQEKKRELAKQVLEGEGMDSGKLQREDLLALLG